MKHVSQTKRVIKVQQVQKARALGGISHLFLAAAILIGIIECYLITVFFLDFKIT